MEGSNRIHVIYLAYRPGSRFYESVGMMPGQSLKPDVLSVYLTLDDADYDRSDTDEIYAACKKRILENASGIRKVEVIPVRKSGFGHGLTRQKAIDASDCEYVLFMTQDAVPCDRFLIENLFTALDNPDAACAYARQRAYREADDVEKIYRLFNYPKKSRTKSAIDIEKYGIKAFFCSDVCCMYKHSVFDLIGGFDTGLKFNEDSIFAFYALSKGYTVEYNADAAVFHSHNDSLKTKFFRSRDLARSQKEHPEVFGHVSSEHEGMKFFTRSASYFIKKRKYSAVISLFLNCAVRYLGYFAGKHGI